jgi:hypothetical protein
LNGYCGVAIYNFFYPLLYYLIFIATLITGNVILSLKIIEALSLIIAPVFFYLWLNKETGNKFASFVGAILYLFVPYRFLLIYVRASPEYLTYTILPILLYLLVCFLKEKENRRKIFLAFLCSLTGGLLIISHNFAAMIILPLVVLYVLLWLIVTKTIRDKVQLFWLLVILISSIGLGAFFVGPAILEMNFVKLATVKTIDYTEHFPTLSQLIKSTWGYYYSSPGVVNDGMSFMLGYAQWLVLGCAIIFLLFKRNIYLIFWTVLSLLTIFLILPNSLFVWQRLKFLQEIQFSWRLLGVAAFTIAALSASILNLIPYRKLTKILGVFFIFIAIIGNRNHLLPQPVIHPEWYDNYEQNHPHRYETTTFADDILNLDSKEACRIDEPMVSIFTLNQQIEPPPFRQAEIKAPFNNRTDVAFAPAFKDSIITQVNRKNTSGQVTINNTKDIKGNIKLNLEFYPQAYEFLVDASLVNYKNCLGRICIENVNFVSGKHTINWRIIQTPIQKTFNYISLFIFVLWIVILIIVFKIKKFK